MIYTELTKKAMLIAYDAHHGQVDKGGFPYVFHPFHLAEQMPDEITCCVALLHDVVEDTKYSLEDLEEKGFPCQVINAVQCLTRSEGSTYDAYIKEIAKNEIARKVKLADLVHNSDLTRLIVVDENTLFRKEKYQKALEELTE